MSWIENLLIIAGASLDVFVAMECQGSMVKKVNKKHLTISCIAIVILQVLAMGIGYSLTGLLYQKNPVSDEALFGEILAILIFFALGLRLIILAVKNEWIVEHLETRFATQKLIMLGIKSGLYSLFAGIAFGCVGTDISLALGILAVISVLFIIAGTYIGYHYGFEQKRIAYIIGAVFLWAAGVELLLRQVIHLF